MRRTASALFISLLFSPFAFAQVELAKFGNDFLTAGGGARALGMGSAQVALASDVTAAYWNVGALSAVETPQFIYMHSERFDGIVGYDYGAIAMPMKNSEGVLSISFFRQGVDNIANTLNAFDRERNQPRENAQDFIERFSAADMAFFLSYSSKRSDNLSLGASAKVVNQRLGPFANAWGYSLDVGAKLHTGFADFGIAVADITTMRKIWEVDEDEFGEDFEEIFDDPVPDGTNEYVLPSVRFGAAKTFSASDFDFVAATDVEMFFENRQAFYINLGRTSFEPHVGGEVTYKKTITFRTGLTDFIDDPEAGFQVSPTLGLGLNFSQFQLDYGFASFAGATDDLGFTHRISLRFDLIRKS